MLWDHGFGFGGLWGALSALFTAVGAFLLFLALIGLAVLLARYLLVATKAAELYVARNGEIAPPPATAATVADAAPAAPTPAEPVGSEAVTEVIPPAAPPKPRTPRKPPAS